MNLHDYGEQFGFEMCDDYSDLNEWATSVGLFDDVSLPGAYVIKVTESVPSWPAAAGAKGETFSHVLYGEISDIYGAPRVAFEIESGDDGDGEMSTWHRRFLQYGVPIGQTYGGDLLIQAVSGAQRGAVYFLNHESWFDFLQYLGSDDDDERAEFEEEAEDVLEELGIESTLGLDSDTFFELVSHDDLDALSMLASDLKTFWRQLGQVQR
jgi:hypothetical protein